MKRKALLLLTISVSALAFTGCQGKNNGTYSKYVKLGDYKGLTADRVVTTISDEDVQNEIQNELYFNSDSNEITDRAAQEGDTVNIDYTGTIDGQEFDGGSDTAMDVDLGSESFLKEFEDSIVGMKTGETKTFQVTFPEDYDGIVDGKTADFTVTVNSITETILPEYNDAYVQANTDYSSTTEYEAALRESLQAYYDEDATYMAETDLLSTIVASSTFDGYPEDLYESAKAQLESDNASFAEELGMEWSEIAGEDYDIDADVLDSVHERLTICAIAEKEDITVSDEDYQSYLESYCEIYGYESTEEFAKNDDAEATRYTLLYDKVLTFLGDNNTFNDVDESDYYSEDEFGDDAELLELEEDTDADSGAVFDTEAVTDTETVSDTEAASDTEA